MERLIKLSAALIIAALTGCCGKPIAVVPKDIPKPIINPVLLSACESTLSLLPPVSENADILTAHRKDVMLYDQCRCRHEALRQAMCSYADAKCEPAALPCTDINKPLQ